MVLKMFSIRNFWVPFHVMKLHCHLLEVKKKQIDEKKLIIAPLNYMFRYLGDSWIARRQYKTSYICNKYLCKGKNIPQDVFYN